MCVTLQGLVDDNCFSSSFLAGQGDDSVCSSSFFMPVPQLTQCTTRHLVVTYLPISICDTDVTFNDDWHELDKAISDTRMGVPPEVPICLGCDHIFVQFMHSDKTISLILGYQVIVYGMRFATNRLYHLLSLGKHELSDVEVICKQVSSHLANNNKQINVLSGQCSCSMKCPMACFMVNKENLGVAPEWI